MVHSRQLALHCGGRMPPERKRERGKGSTAIQLGAVLHTQPNYWKTINTMHGWVYNTHKAVHRAIKRLLWCLYQQAANCPSGDPGMVAEGCNAKMAWLHIHAKSECAIGSSDNEMDKLAGDDDVVKNQELFGGESMAHTMTSIMTTKKVTELDNESGSSSNTDMSAFEKLFKRAKN
eukprot:1198567-Ditylum_brightwellii.AAC.1